MNETRLRTIEQVARFLSPSGPVEFSVAGDGNERYRHISRALKRFDYPRRSKLRTPRAAEVPAAHP